MTTTVGRIRGVEKVNIAVASGPIQEWACDSVLITNFPEVGAVIVQFFDLYAGSPQRLKETPRLLGTMRLSCNCVFEDDIVTNGYHVVGQDGTVIRIKPPIGLNLRMEHAGDEASPRLIRKLWEMHGIISELERQEGSIANPEARAKLLASLANVRRQTSEIEKHLSGTVFVTEGPDKGKGAQ